MGLIYCGIDEAGYGPMLGPMCVGCTAVRLDSWDSEAGAPNLWRLLSRAVCRSGADKRRRIAVADSKKLKLSNQLKTKHPLTHLERGVLTFAPLVDAGASFDASRACDPAGESGEVESGASPAAPEGGTPAPHTLDTDTGLFAALGVRLEPHGWYAGEPTPLPLAGSAAQLAIARNKLALTCESAGISPLAMACITVGEREFNEVVRTGGSKGHVTGRCFARFLRRVVERWGGGQDDVRVVCDRHGGRTSYGRMIGAAVRDLGFEIETLEETERCSRYRVGERVTVLFMPEAEEAHLPVALASMTAKLVRELAMMRFNRYWCARMPELKPTAGYVQDARRWLGDLEGVLCDDDRETLVRMA